VARGADPVTTLFREIVTQSVREHDVHQRLMTELLTLQKQARDLAKEWLWASSTTPPQRQVLADLATQWANILNARAEILQNKRNLVMRLCFLKESRQRLERLCSQSLAELIDSRKFALPLENNILAAVTLTEKPSSSLSPAATSTESPKGECEDSSIDVFDPYHLDDPAPYDKYRFWSEYEFSSWTTTDEDSSY
jgi:hypothetical protein